MSGENAQSISFRFGQPHCLQILETVEAAVKQVRVLGEQRKVSGIVGVEDAMVVAPAWLADLRDQDPFQLALESALENPRKVVRLYRPAENGQLFHQCVPNQVERGAAHASLGGACGAQRQPDHYRTCRNK